MAETSSSPRSRPLSPHLQIYRWPVTMGTSILHRISGFGLALGTVLLAGWLVAAALGPDVYALFESAAFHWFGRFILFGFTVALVYHAFNGIRHLMWDMGIGFKVSTANRSGIAVYVLTLAVTLAIWVLAYRSMGGL